MLRTPPKHDRAHHMGAIGHRGPRYRHRAAERRAPPHPLHVVLWRLSGFDDTPQLKQNAPRYETAEKRLGDTPTGATTCLFLSQDAKCPSWAVIR